MRRLDVHYINIVKESKNTVKLALTPFNALALFYTSVILGVEVKATLALVVIGGLIEASTRWLSEMLTESRSLGKYTRKVNKSLIIGLLLFVSSEVFLFGTFFWTIIDRFANESIFEKTTFLQNQMAIIDYLPSEYLVGTVLLVASSISFNVYSAYYGSYNVNDDFTYNCWATQGLGVCFVIIQLFEYQAATNNIAATAIGSAFYILTGFHGLHVIIGIVIMVIQQAYVMYEMRSTTNVGLYYSCLYWHFVDVVWILVVYLVYINMATAIIYFQTNQPFFY